MNNDNYSLSDSYVSVSGGNLVPQAVDDFARVWVAGNYMAAFAMIVILSMVVVYFMFYKAQEHFNPTQSLRMQSGDQFGLGTERLANPPNGKSAFAQQVQTQGPSINANAQAILNSTEFNCAGRKAAGDNAWDWMNNVAHENMEGKPKDDNAFSKVLAGH